LDIGILKQATLENVEFLALKFWQKSWKFHFCIVRSTFSYWSA
jgi:hypothetical protein